MVDLMGGTIEVNSELNKGTTFKVVMDFDYIEEEQSEWENNKTERHDYSGLSNKYVILCEDNQLNMEIAMSILDEYNIRVATAVNGEECVRIFDSAPAYEFDAILMDLRMPVMGGIEAAREIRKSTRPDAALIPIIAMTADVFADDVQECMEAGMNDHVAKPIDPDELLGKLSKLI
jgi:CheY-like chemotaxis protein